MYQCIGKRWQRNGELILCSRVSDTPTWRDLYLCSECANSRSSDPGLRKSKKDEVNVGAMQTDLAEYKEQIDAGFALFVNRQRQSDEDN